MEALALGLIIRGEPRETADTGLFNFPVQRAENLVSARALTVHLAMPRHFITQLHGQGSESHNQQRGAQKCKNMGPFGRMASHLLSRQRVARAA